MMEWMIPILAGALTGILSGFGIGGGTLLLIYMTSFAGVPQNLAQGVNLLYFLPTAATALPAHIKNGYVDRTAATGLDVHLLRRCFGVYLLYVGVTELFRKKSNQLSPESGGG